MNETRGKSLSHQSSFFAVLPCKVLNRLTESKMDKTDRPDKDSPKVFPSMRGIFLFCGLLLAFAGAAERSAGNDDRHILHRCACPPRGIDAGPKNILPQPVQIGTPEGARAINTPTPAFFRFRPELEDLSMFSYELILSEQDTERFHVDLLVSSPSGVSLSGS